MKKTSFKIFILMLTAGIVSVAAVLLLVFEIIAISESYREITDEHFENTRYSSEIRAQLYKHQALVGNHVSATEDGQYDYYESEAKLTEEQIKEVFLEFGERMSGGDRERIYHNAYTEFLSYLQNAENAMTFSRAGNKGTANYYVVTIMYGHVQEVNAAFDELDEFTSQEIADAKEQMNRYIQFSFMSASISIVLITISVIVTSTYCFKLTLRAEEAANSANEANKAKSNFLAMMSHEIRTPLNAVIGMNEMILQESGEENVLMYADKACNAGRTLLSIINNILDVSKIEAGKFEVVEDEYDIYSLVCDCYNLTSDRAEKKGLALTYHSDENLPSKLYGDMFHIRQIAVNFITNAIKYTDRGSVEISFSGKGQEQDFCLCISVKDTGIGLTEESKEKLFTSFQRFDMKRNASVEGTGLGLAICKQLAELMNGTIEVESEYGKGSVFRIIVPQKIIDSTPMGRLSQIHTGHKQTENGIRYTVRDARVLVVDDYDMNLLVFKSLVKDTGLIVDTAESGRECLALAGEKKYDIIFMDHMMPEMDGIETLHHLKQLRDNPNSDTPVIMLTANAVSGSRDTYFAQGFSGYLSKPVEKDKLDEILMRYLPQEKWDAADTADEEAARDTDLADVSADDTVESVTEGALKESATESPVTKPEAGSRFDCVKAAFPDADIETGLKYCSDMEDFYAELLKDLGHSGKKEELQAAYDNRDWKLYGVKVHALKGAAKTLGLESLRAVSERLQNAAENGETGYIENSHNEMIAMLDTLAECTKEL